MKQLLHSLRGFLQEEDGPTAVEYAVLLALIILVCFGAVMTLGNNTNQSFTQSKNKLHRAFNPDH